MKKKSSAAAAAIFTILIFACSGPGDQQPKYYTADADHIWKDISDDHVPQISFLDDKKTKVKASVPLKPTQNPGHYIEVIALMEGEKEIASKQFLFSYNKAEAEFVLPDPAKTYWILVKCNKHDMWKADVR